MMVLCGSFEVYGAVDGSGTFVAVTTRKVFSGDVAFSEGALVPGDFAGCSQRRVMDSAGFGGDDGYGGFCGAEGFDFGFCEGTCADDEAGAAGEL